MQRFATDRPPLPYQWPIRGNTLRHETSLVNAVVHSLVLDFVLRRNRQLRGASNGEHIKIADHISEVICGELCQADLVCMVRRVPEILQQRRCNSWERLTSLADPKLSKTQKQAPVPWRKSRRSRTGGCASSKQRCVCENWYPLSIVAEI